MKEQCPRCGAPLEKDATVCHKCRFIVLTAQQDYDAADEDIPVIPTGTILQDDYRIVRMLGTGGSGTVYEARQISLQNARVALKVLHPDLNNDQSTINLLKREVIVCRELTHQNIMKVYSMEKIDDGHFIVMEYVLGGSFQDRLDKSGKMSVEKASRVFLQACDALEYAHGRGVIHLDIKPANILLGPGDSVKLCDFGIARMAVNRITTATQRIVTGSVGYMPPEQYRGRDAVSYRSDIYSLAATMYTALTGAVPIGIIEHEEIPQSVVQAMSRDPEDRYESVRAFREAFVAETGIHTDAVGVGLPAARPVVKDLHEASSVEPGSVTLDEPKKIEPMLYNDKAGAPGSDIIPTTPNIASISAPPVQRSSKTLGRIKTKLASRREVWRPTISSAPKGKSPESRAVRLAAWAGLAALFMLLIWLSFRGEYGDREIPTPKQSAATSAMTKTKADGKTPNKISPAQEAAARGIQAAVSRFVGLLNFNQADQAAALLTSELREKLTIEKFQDRFFRTPRLWKMKILSISNTGNGQVVVKVNVMVVDAFEGSVKSRIGRLQMIKKNMDWKISEIDFG